MIMMTTIPTAIIMKMIIIIVVKTVGFFQATAGFNKDINSNEILIKREPLVHTRARRAVQKKKSNKNGFEMHF